MSAARRTGIRFHDLQPCRENVSSSVNTGFVQEARMVSTP